MNMTHETLGTSESQQKNLPPIPAFSLTGSLSPLLIVPMSIPVLIALFAPINVLDLWPWMKQLTEWVQKLLPFIKMNGHASSTSYAEVALLVHCLTVLLIPLLSLVWMGQSILNYPYILERNRVSKNTSWEMHFLTLFIAPPLFLGAIYLFVTLPGDPSFARGITTENRGGFALLTLFLLYSTTAVLGAQLSNLRLFIDICLKKKSN